MMVATSLSHWQVLGKLALGATVTPKSVDVTLEISNTTPLPAKVYANEGLCQILFFHGNEPCEVSYADRKGKYQKQQGIVLPKL